MNIFIIAVFLFWRVFLFFVAWLGEKILTFSPRFPYSDILLIPSHLPNWLWSFANFDGVHYLTIAGNGYSVQFTQVFFPFYPQLIGVLTHTFISISPIVIGLFISNFFFLLSLFMLKKVLVLDYKKEPIKWTLLILLSFPTSFFFGSVYTESLFLFLALAAFYTARKKHWFLSGFLGALASSTKLIGIFLYPALLLEWYEYKSHNKNEKLELDNDRLKSSNIFIKIYHLLIITFQSPLSLIPVGLLSYMLYLQVRFGDWLYFWHVQPVFGAARSGGGIILLPQVLWRYFKILTSVSFQTEAFWISLLELVSAIGAFSLLIFAYFKKIRLSYLLFSFLSILIPTLTGTFSSMPRYVLMAFPIFIIAGMLKSKLAKSIIILIFTVLLIILTVLFTRGHWVA